MSARRPASPLAFRLLLVSCGVLVLLAGSGSALAEWLVLRDGTNIAIKGPWKVRGRSVQFTTMSNELQMLPLEDVDLALSEAVSKTAKEDKGWTEVKSTPQAVFERSTVEGAVIGVNSQGSLVAVDTTFHYYQYKGTDGGAQCIPATPIAASDTGELVVQIGTKIERVQILGISNPSAEAIRAAVGKEQVCLEQEDGALRRNDKGHFESYVWLADGRDLGFELIRAGAARVADSTFARKADYQNGKLKVSGPAMSGHAWTPQMSRYAPPPDTSLLKWIEDPNAPRVAGTMSSPGLRVSSADLLREGRELLEDPAGAAAALRAEYNAAYSAYKACSEMATSADALAACTATYNVGVESVNERAGRASEAISAARQEASLKASEDAEAQREIDRAMNGDDEKTSAPQKVTVEVVVKDAAGKETGRSSTDAEKSEKPPLD